MTSTAQMRMRSYIQRVATGPEMGKSISLLEAKDALSSILDDVIDPVQAAIYLIALRMKRETDDEFVGSLLGLQQHVTTALVDVADLIDLSDPFDGFTRCVPAATFLPAVLAALGLPTVLQGAASLGPKYGVTHRLILQAAGCKLDLTPQHCANQIENPAIAWAYLDQRHSCPALHNLLELRERMVKRSVLTTIESLSRPLKAQRVHLISGFVHRAYPPIYALLAQQSGFASAALIKGVEGGVVPTLSQVSRLFRYDQQTPALQQLRLDPLALGIKQAQRAAPLPENLPAPPTVPSAVPNAIPAAVNAEALAAISATTGLAALHGAPGMAYDSLVYAASICLVHLGKMHSFADAAQACRKVLDSGKAYAHFAAALL